MEIRRSMQHIIEEGGEEEASTRRAPDGEAEEEGRDAGASRGGWGRGGGLAMYHRGAEGPMQGGAGVGMFRDIAVEDGEQLDGALLVRKYARGGRRELALRGVGHQDDVEVGSPADSGLMRRKYARYLQ